MNRKKLKILPNLPKMLFQRVVMVCISILAQVAVLCTDDLAVSRISNDFIYWVLFFLSMGATLFIISKNTNPAYKIAWLVPILMFPVFGGRVLFVAGRQPIVQTSAEEDEFRRGKPAAASPTES